MKKLKLKNFDYKEHYWIIVNNLVAGYNPVFYFICSKCSATKIVKLTPVKLRDGAGFNLIIRESRFSCRKTNNLSTT